MHFARFTILGSTLLSFRAIWLRWGDKPGWTMVLYRLEAVGNYWYGCFGKLRVVLQLSNFHVFETWLLATTTDEVLLTDANYTCLVVSGASASDTRKQKGILLFETVLRTARWICKSPCGWAPRMRDGLMCSGNPRLIGASSIPIILSPGTIDDAAWNKPSV